MRDAAQARRLISSTNPGASDGECLEEGQPREAAPRPAPSTESCLSAQSSACSSSMSSPAPGSVQLAEQQPACTPVRPDIAQAMAIPAGTHPVEYYRSQMSPWKFRIRSCLLRSLEREMFVLEFIQRRFRSSVLDWLMIHSSWLGSHSFFTVALSVMFWFGHPRFARTLVYNFAASVYVTGTVKDLLCLPRPFSPPIERLTISNHASEYGFPSTHAATSTGTILIAFQHLFQLSHSVFHRIGLVLALIVYAFFLIFGRAYCGMHAIQDILFGATIGTSVWLMDYRWGGYLREWIEGGGTANRLNALSPPVLIIIIGLGLTAAHPQPIDDCPCFQDSTAFVAVTVGVMIGQWSGQIDNLPPVKEGLSFGIIRIILGMLIIFGWRFVMKELLSRTLPPLFRFFSPLVQLPRRHYNSTIDYKSYLDELKEHRRRNGLGATLIPSLLHLPASGCSSSISSPSGPRQRLASSSIEPQDVTTDVTQLLHPALRNHSPDAHQIDPLVKHEKIGLMESPKTFPAEKPESETSPELLHSEISHTKSTIIPVKHYDVDVLMRLIVYAGIGLLASTLLPMLFSKLGV